MAKSVFWLEIMPLVVACAKSIHSTRHFVPFYPFHFFPLQSHFHHLGSHYENWRDKSLCFQLKFCSSFCFCWHKNFNIIRDVKNCFISSYNLRSSITSVYSLGTRNNFGEQNSIFLMKSLLFFNWMRNIKFAFRGYHGSIYNFIIPKRLILFVWFMFAWQILGAISLMQTWV